MSRFIHLLILVVLALIITSFFWFGLWFNCAFADAGGSIVLNCGPFSFITVTLSTGYMAISTVRIGISIPRLITDLLFWSFLIICWALLYRYSKHKWSAPRSQQS